MSIKRIARSSDEFSLSVTAFTKAIGKAQQAPAIKPQPSQQATTYASQVSLHQTGQSSMPAASYGNQPPGILPDFIANVDLDLNEDEPSEQPPRYVVPLEDIPEADRPIPDPRPDPDQLADEIAEGDSLDLVAEEHDGVADRDDVIEQLEAAGYEIEESDWGLDGDNVRKTEITDPQTGETITEFYFEDNDRYQISESGEINTSPMRNEDGWKVTVEEDAESGETTTRYEDDLGDGTVIEITKLPSGVVIEETTDPSGGTTTVVVDEDGNRTTLDDEQETDRESIDDIAEDISEGRDIEQVAEERGLTDDQIIAQLKAAGYIVISQDIYDEEGNNIGWYQEIISQDDNEVIAYYERSSAVHSESDDSSNLNRAEGIYEVSSSIDAQGRWKEVVTFTPDGPFVEGHTLIETVIDENGRKTKISRDDNGETIAVTDNDYTLVTSPDGTTTLHDAESDIEIPLEPGGHEESLAEELLELDLDSEEGKLTEAEIMAFLEGSDENGEGGAIEDLENELNARNEELAEAIEEHGASSSEAAQARAASNIAYAAWAEAVAITNYRNILLLSAATDPHFTEVMNNVDAHINEMLAPYGRYLSRPSPHYTHEEAQEMLEQAELELELARDAKAEYEEAERLTEGDQEMSLMTQAQIDELFAQADLHNAKGDSFITDYEVNRLERMLKNTEPGTNLHTDLSDALDNAESQQDLADGQLELAQSQYNLSALNRQAYDEAEALAEDYVEERVIKEGYFDKYDQSFEGFRIFGTHSGEYVGYTLDERDNGELWVYIHYENKTQNVQLTPAAGEMTSWWEENRNSELISQWHETFDRRESAQSEMHKPTIPLYESLEAQTGSRIVELENTLAEQLELFGPMTIEAPENATPEHELIGLESLPLQVPPEIAEQYAESGLDALLESGLPVRIMIDSANQSTREWFASNNGWMWVQPEMAHTMLELQESRSQQEAIRLAIEKQNTLSTLPRRLGETDTEYLNRAAHDSLDDAHREQTLGTIYQPQFQELFEQQAFSQNFESLEGVELTSRVRDTFNREMSDKAFHSVMEEINDIGGDNPEVAGVPIFYVGQNGDQLQTALVAVRDENDNTLYIDATGRHYEDVEDFQNNNKLFQGSGRLVIPQGFDMTPSTDGDIPLEVIDIRNPLGLEELDQAVAGVSTVATVASFTPASPIAAPIATLGGLYLGIRQGFNQVDHIQHGGDWSDRQSVMNSLGVATSLLPVGTSAFRAYGMASTYNVTAGQAFSASIGAVRSGSNLALNAQLYMQHAGRLNKFSRVADGVGMAAGLPLMGDSFRYLYHHDHEMSDSQKAQAIVDLATGVVGTGLGARGLWLTRPGQDDAGDFGPNSSLNPHEMGSPWRITGELNTITTNYSPPHIREAMEAIDTAALQDNLMEMGVNRETAQAFAAGYGSLNGSATHSQTGTSPEPGQGKTPEAIAERLAASAIGSQSRMVDRAVETQSRMVDRAVETQSRIIEQSVALTTEQEGGHHPKGGSNSKRPSPIPEQVNNIPASEPATDLASEQVIGYKPVQLEGLTTKQIREVSPKHLSQIPPGRLTYLTHEQVAAFTKKQIAALTNEQVRKLTPPQLRALSAKQIHSFTLEQLASFRPKQIAAFTREQISAFTNEQIISLSPKQIAAFTGIQLRVLNTTKLRNLSDVQLQSISPEALTQIKLKRLVWLRPEQISALTTEQIRALSIVQIAALMPSQVAMLTQNQVKALSSKQWHAFTPAQLKKFGSEQLQLAPLNILKRAERPGTISVSFGPNAPIIHLHGLTQKSLNMLVKLGGSIHGEGSGETPMLSIKRDKLEGFLTPAARKMLPSGPVLYVSLESSLLAGQSTGQKAIISAGLGVSTAVGIALSPYPLPNILAYALRGGSFWYRSFKPDATAAHTVQGRILRGMEFFTTTITTPGAIQSAVTLHDPFINGSNGAGNVIYGTKTLIETITGKEQWTHADNFGLPLYFGGSLPYTESSFSDVLSGNKWAFFDVATGGLFGIGSALLWRSTTSWQVTKPHLARFLPFMLTSSEKQVLKEWSKSANKERYIFAATIGSGLWFAGAAVISSLPDAAER